MASSNEVRDSIKWLKGIRAKKIVRPRICAIDLVFADGRTVTYYPAGRRSERVAVLSAFAQKGGR